ncbi:MAG: cadherin repeat domain-containing protein, partial [Chloroflexi bacterium]|nr:cadherin repeat domain-containing protein [Chloroflexota bacterium]
PVQALSYSILGGADAALFALDPLTGALSFLSPPDFEAPKDAGADNVYNLTVQVSDGMLTAAQNISIQVAFFVPLTGFAP